MVVYTSADSPFWPFSEKDNTLHAPAGAYANPYVTFTALNRKIRHPVDMKGAEIRVCLSEEFLA